MSLTPLPATSGLLTTREAAAWLRISMPTLERMRLTGSGPRFIKLGPGKRARVVYRLADLEAYLTSQYRFSTSDRGLVS